MSRAAALVAVLALLAGCGSSEPPPSGVVTGRRTSTTFVLVGKVLVPITYYYVSVRPDSGTSREVMNQDAYVQCQDGDRYPECAR